MCASENLPDTGTIEYPIANHPKDKRRVYPCIHPRDVMRYAPRPAVTTYTVERRAGPWASCARSRRWPSGTSCVRTSRPSSTPSRATSSTARRPAKGWSGMPCMLHASRTTVAATPISRSTSRRRYRTTWLSSSLSPDRHDRTRAHQAWDGLSSPAGSSPAACHLSSRRRRERIAAAPSASTHRGIVVRATNPDAARRGGTTKRGNGRAARRMAEQPKRVLSPAPCASPCASCSQVCDVSSAFQRGRAG